MEEIPPDQGNDLEDDPMDTLPVQSQSPMLDDYDLPPLDDDDDAFFGGLDIAEDGPVFSGETTDRAVNTRSFSAGRSTEVALHAPAAPLASITAAMAPVVSYVAESVVGQEVPGETSPRVSNVSSGAEPEGISPNGNHKVLLLQLASCGSRERDNRRLKQIYGFLTSTPGNDQFAFLCQENGQTVRLDFPNDNTCINDSMLREVRGIVGEANVIIEE
jgi:hypothetical protein